MRRAKILATLGPATHDPAVIESLLAAGVNGVRINMSHGTQEEKAEDIRIVRAAAKKLNHSLAVLVDLAGPKIRTGALKDARPVTLKADAQFTITTRQVEGNADE